MRPRREGTGGDVMKDRRPALGKGLSALFPAVAAREGQSGVEECPVHLIDAAPDQPRKRFDEKALEELAQSIRESGVIQPLLVSREGDRYRLIAGERRLRAARMAGLISVPVLVRQAGAQEAFLVALIENLQREDLGPMEEARAYQRLVTEYGWSQEEIARRVGKDRSTVANALRLLQAGKALTQALEEGRVSEGIARALLGLPEEAQEGLLERAQQEGLSVRQVESLVRRMRSSRDPRPGRRQGSALDDYFRLSRERLEAALGLPVTISRRGHRGQVRIAFRSLQELRSLLSRLPPEAPGA